MDKIQKYEKVIHLLKNESNMCFTDIGKATGFSSSHVKRINDGKIKTVRYIFKDISFPIREPKEERNKRIMNDLKDGMSVKDAAQKYEMADSGIRMVAYRINKK